MQAKCLPVFLGFLVLPLSAQSQSIDEFLAFQNEPVPISSTPAAPVAPSSAPSFGLEPDVLPPSTLKLDPNETAEISQRYSRAQKLIARGAWRRAQTILEQGLAKFPESRHLNRLYSDLLWYQSRGGEDAALTRLSGAAAVKAMEVALGFGTVDFLLTERLAQTLGRTGDEATFEQLFAEALTRAPHSIARYQYAMGLSRMGSPRAEDAFKAAIKAPAEGDAHASYAEWLFDRSRHADALNMLPASPQKLYYLHFLRGVALERANRTDEAREAYQRFRDFSAHFPAPAKFRIQGSTLQQESGIHFDDEAGKRREVSTDGLISAPEALVDQDALNGLSYLLWIEGRGESYGAMLAEGWVVRARVLRGSVGDNPCPVVQNSGTTLADQYKSVICQSGQFENYCTAWCSNPATTACSRNATTDSAAYDTFYGYKADPVSGHCPGGPTNLGNLCDGSQTCNGHPHTYKLKSPLFNRGVSTSSSCPTICAPDIYGKVCGNGGTLENCFYGNDACVGAKRFTYNGSVTTSGGLQPTVAFQATLSGTVRGHLEGPETQQFNLYLDQGTSASGPWTQIASSARVGSVEEVIYTGGASGTYYRWRVVSASGTGAWSLCEKRP
jgi:tetratricopeptide (TPR) repeat protein